MHWELVLTVTAVLSVMTVNHATPENGAWVYKNNPLIRSIVMVEGLPFPHDDYLYLVLSGC